MKPSSRSVVFLIRAGLALLLSIALGEPLAGADPWPEWNRKLHAAIELLESGDPSKALQSIEDLLGEYLELAGSGKGNEENLGTLLVYRALADYRTGDVEAARWDWDVASSFLPEASKLDLSRFGEAGTALLAFAAAPGPLEEMTALHVKVGNCTKCSLIEPKPTMRPKIRYTSGARYFEVEGPLIVRVIVDERGQISRPVVLRKTAAPGLTFSAFETMRRWKFEPARLDGRPIRYFYTLTVNYRMQ